MSERDDAGLRYAAFLSYSHKDAAAAGRLHRKLEAYRLPARLIGVETARGAVPARLWPIFRDRDELPAATDLTETVRGALAQSGALIVLCSPHAAASLWVAEEINVFREIHPDRPVLAAVLDGDPPACFPEVLRAYGKDGTWHEPLATDLRPDRDGVQLGLLKLVAGITGLGLDALVQRDAARKIRRVTVVTAVAAVAMLIMAALTWFALDARREAERQRAEAEALVEFMLTDLRDRLQGVGRLDIMEAVNLRALRYYGARQDLSGLSDESLARRARILHAIGEDELVRETLPAALAAFREARQITAEQLVRAPDDPRRLFEHSKSELGIGRAYEIHRDWPMAQRYYEAASSLAVRLVAIEPRNADYLLRAASLAVDLGNIHLNGNRDYAAAQRSYERAVQWFSQAAGVRPRDLHVMAGQANAYGWLADSFFVRRCWAQSRDARLRQYRIMEELAELGSNNAEIRFRFAAARRGLAHSYHQLGDRGEARLQLDQASAASAQLTRDDPGNAQWRSLNDLLQADLRRMPVRQPGAAANACQSRGSRTG